MGEAGSIIEGVRRMSKLLYAEKTRSYIWRKYPTFAGGLIVTFFMILVAVGVAISPDLPEGERLNYLFLSSFLAILWTAAIIYGGVLPFLSSQRFEIYDDRIALPIPRKTSHLTRRPETIMKSDLEATFLDYTEKGGAFKRKIPGMDDYGLRGEWRCVLTFKNGETFILTHKHVKVKGECIPALKEFVRGIEE